MSSDYCAFALPGAEDPITISFVKTSSKVWLFAESCG